MTLINKIGKLLTTDLTDLPSAVRAETTAAQGADLEIENGRALSLDSYTINDLAAGRRHTFELRYAAYGEKSNMVCETFYASRGSAKSEGFDNALTTTIDLEGKPVASAVLVLDSKEGLAADDHFSAELARLRQVHGRKLAELNNLVLSRENKSRRALGAMFHVLYLYARQARQMNVILVQTSVQTVSLLERLLGFRAIAQQGEHALVILEMDKIKREQRQWGGQKEAGIDSPHLLYPFFFPSKDEAGLLFRLLDHLGK